MVIESIISINPLAFHIIVIVLSLVIISKAADLLTFGMSDYAKKLGVSHYIIGFLVIGIGTSLPELIASATGAMLGQAGLVFGTILGSNMFKIVLIGLMFILARKSEFKKEHVGSPPAIILGLTFLPVVLVFDGTLSRIDGVILLGCYLYYGYRLWKKEEALGKIKKSIMVKSIFKDMLIFLGSLAALLLAGRWLVFSSINVSSTLGISPYLTGLIVIGIGASVPELTVQIHAARKKHHGMAFGNAYGSLAANSSFALGIVALINPLLIQFSTIYIASMFLFLGIMMSFLFIRSKEIDWQHGVLLILIYIFFIVLEILW